MNDSCSVYTFCKGLGCCDTELSICLQCGPVPLQTALSSASAVLSSFSLKTFRVFQLLETSFAPKLPQSPAHLQTPSMLLSAHDLHPLLLLLVLSNPASQPDLFSSLNSPCPAFSLILPRPSQGFSLRSLRFYSASAILVLSCLSVHKFEESSGRVITFEH